LKRKNQTIFLTATVSKKAKFVKFGVKKANLANLAHYRNLKRTFEDLLP